jgi:hypothetical protein
LDARLISIGAASLAGLVAGGALWALSGGNAQSEAIDALDARLGQISTGSRGRPERPSDALAQSLALPLFGAPTTPPGGQSDVLVQVFGLVRTPARTGALLAIGAAPSEWFSLGEEKSGVTLKAVTNSSAVVATIFGEREIVLGAGSSPTPEQAAGGSPPGFRSPPPPASAPGMSQ